MGSFDMLFLLLKANYGEKISLLRIFSLVNTNAPGLRDWLIDWLIDFKKTMRTMTLSYRYVD